jgi:TRAP-type C4-dicarboxylate transport system substrate-binding protein
MVPEIFVFSKKVWDTLSPLDQQLIRKAAVLTTERERKLWAEREQASLAMLKEKGIEVITEIDKEPFIKATEEVRMKFGAKFTDLIKRAAAVK